LWKLPREESAKEVAAFNDEAGESEWLESGGFMAAPVGFGDFVIVPVNNGGAISIHALDPQSGGKTVWQSFLCDEPETGSVPWAAIELSLEGSDLFVNCGMGVVFVLDPATGTVRFAKRYKRVGQADNFGRRSGWTVNRLNFDGWSSDIVIPYGKQMVCFSSDTDSIEALDRNTGELIWRTEMSPVGFKVDYIIGVYEDVLYAGGFETVVAYDLKGQGRMIWGTEQMFDGRQSLGRGIVTPKGIYLPVEDRIYQLSLKGRKGRAEVLKQVHVDLGTNAPVGNLYSDGERFWVHGANRLYMLDAKQVD
jgi:outer membrane protein assembly factor BamB